VRGLNHRTMLIKVRELRIILIKVRWLNHRTMLFKVRELRFMLIR
jgi:hypothetical protein